MSQLLTDPILTGDAAPTVRSGVRVATTVPAALVTFVAGAVVDTVVLAVGNRILIKDQASADENGIYEVQAAGAPLRSLEMATGQVGSGITCFVREGVSNGGTYWACTNAPALVGTNSLIFQRADAFGTLSVARGGTGVSAFGGTNTLLYTPLANTLSSLGTAANAVLATGAGGVPSLTTTLPSGLLLPNPRVSTGIYDGTGLLILDLPSVASAVNRLAVANATTGNPPSLTAAGTDPNVALQLQAKGTGAYQLRGTSTKAAELRVYEQTTNGTSYVGLTAGNVTGAGGSYTARLPLKDGLLGQYLLTDGAGNWSFSTAVPGGTQRVTYSLSTAIAVGNTTAFSPVSYFTWLQSQYNTYAFGILIYEVVYVNRTLEIEIVNETTAAVIAGPTSHAASGFFSMSIPVPPVADARLSVQIRKTAAGGTSPQVYGMTLQFNAPTF